MARQSRGATFTIAPKVLAAYEQLVASVPGLERKGAAMPYTSVNGNMFSFLDKAGALSLRLPDHERGPSWTSTTPPSASSMVL